MDLQSSAALSWPECERLRGLWEGFLLGGSQWGARESMPCSGTDLCSALPAHGSTDTVTPVCGTKQVASLCQRMDNSKRMILSLHYLRVPDAFARVGNCDPGAPLDMVLCHLFHKCAQCCVVAVRAGMYSLHSFDRTSAASCDTWCFYLCLNSKGSEAPLKYRFGIEKFSTAHIVC